MHVQVNMAWLDFFFKFWIQNHLRLNQQTQDPNTLQSVHVVQESHSTLCSTTDQVGDSGVHARCC